MFLQKLQIKNISLENNILLAPMAGITDLPFRLICREFGTALTFTEMVSAKALFYKDEKTKKLLNIEGEKKPISAQIFGSDEESMSYAAKYVSKNFDMIDINMGCPAPTVTKHGDGSSLLQDLNKAGRIIDCVVKNSSKPVTLKIRLGWDKEHIVASEIAKTAEDLGVSAITVHGRTRTEYFAGHVNLEEIRRVKEAVKIPVIGNGDIIDEISAKQMFETTGVDGIMIGRAALGNPWILKRIINYLKTGECLPEIQLEDKFNVIKKHFLLEIGEKGEYTGIREFRKHLAAYTKNMPNSSVFRSKINLLETKNEVLSALDEYFEFLR